MKDCIFCKIAKGDVPAKIVYKSGKVIVFHDITPKAPVHVLVVPIKHIESLANVEKDDKELLGELFLTVKKIAFKLGISHGFKIFVNNGKHAGQVIFHLHIHVLGGWKTVQKEV